MENKIEEQVQFELLDEELLLTVNATLQYSNHV